MPTYEYECEKCGHRFELFQLMTDKPRKRCPKCRGKVRRLLGTGAGIIFKGSGFYATDYRKGKPPKEEGKPPKEAKEAGTESKKAKGDSKTDTSKAKGE